MFLMWTFTLLSSILSVADALIFIYFSDRVFRVRITREPFIPLQFRRLHSLTRAPPTVLRPSAYRPTLIRFARLCDFYIYLFFFFFGSHQLTSMAQSCIVSISITSTYTCKVNKLTALKLSYSSARSIPFH